MTRPIPQPGRYREKATDYAVEVLSSGDHWVSVRIPAQHPHKVFHVARSRFWDDYEEVK